MGKNKFSGEKKKFKLGEYIRLSKEDINKNNETSDSIVTQKNLLDDYYMRHSDEFEYALCYIDDGCTGTDTNRVGFQRLLADIYAKKINCVIVKDLSRLSRNYADAGSIIENLFISMDIRFISLGENIDSYHNPDSASGLIVPITNVINDNFCYQTSKKIRQVFDYKRRNGEFIGSFAAFGYMKNPLDKHAIIIDEEAATVVRDIFAYFLSGMSKSAIVRRLNTFGILCPTEYKKTKGLNYYNPHAQEKPLWSAKTVTAILKNQLYTGDMIQGRQRVKSYKIHKLEQVAPQDWYIAANTHAPIIDRESFRKVQLLLERNAPAAYGSDTPYLFSGFLRCADCGKALSRSKVKNYIYYFCRTYKTFGNSACTKHSIRHDILENTVSAAIKEHIQLNAKQVDAFFIPPNTENNPTAALDKYISIRKAELVKITRYKKLAFEDWKDGRIEEGEYRRLNNIYDDELTNICEILEKLQEEKDTQQQKDNSEKNLNFDLNEYNFTLSRPVLSQFVDYIEIHEGGNINVKFKNCDAVRGDI